MLPQGKFSEFLKLEGMERNKILERLFHLEKYGERLAFLVKEQAGQWEGKRKEQEGALSRYEAVTTEAIQALEQKETELEKNLAKKEEALKKIWKTAKGKFYYGKNMMRSAKRKIPLQKSRMISLLYRKI